ncbi:MAG: PAS domain S-box protein [Candidatus Thorarchaeota archaeon]|jgi:PAS domain S-box-containing protein
MNTQNDLIAVTSIDDYLIDYQTIYENFSDGITIFDANGKHIWCNTAALEIFGYSDQHEVSGMSFSAFIHPDYRNDEMKILNEIRAGDHIQLRDSTFPVFRKDGTTFPAHSRATPIYKDSKFIGFQSHICDITRIKDIEKRLRSSLSAIDLLASIIQHDMRNDFHVVENAVEAALMTMEGNTMPVQFLSMAKSGLRRMRGLLTLLAPTISKDSEHIENLIEERLCHTKEMHPDANAILVKPVSLKPAAINERRLLVVVFDNFFRNAITYAGSDSTIVVKIEQFEETTQIDIVDNGPGVSGLMRETLFEKGASTSGSGLGLHICKRIVEGYGGTITLLDSSDLGIGAAFRITLPIDLPEL